MKQEIDRKVKKMKREEMARINLLVERAMAADPRLRREKERDRLEKERQAEAKRKSEMEKAEAERLAKEKQEAEEAAKKAQEDVKKKDAKVRIIGMQRFWFLLLNLTPKLTCSTCAHSLTPETERAAEEAVAQSKTAV